MCHCPVRSGSDRPGTIEGVHADRPRRRQDAQQQGRREEIGCGEAPAAIRTDRRGIREEAGQTPFAAEGERADGSQAAAKWLRSSWEAEKYVPAMVQRAIGLKERHTSALLHRSIGPSLALRTFSCDQADRQTTDETLHCNDLKHPHARNPHCCGVSASCWRRWSYHPPTATTATRL